MQRATTIFSRILRLLYTRTRTFCNFCSENQPSAPYIPTPEGGGFTAHMVSTPRPKQIRIVSVAATSALLCKASPCRGRKGSNSKAKSPKESSSGPFGTERDAAISQLLHQQYRVQAEMQFRRYPGPFSSYCGQSSQIRPAALLAEHYTARFPKRPLG